jgi:hypothetical protein
MNAIRESRVRAEVLHHGVQRLEPNALLRLRALPELRKAEPAALRAAASTIRRKHCLAVVANELGFASWEHARRVLDGDVSEVDFGKLLYGDTLGARLNHWFAHYEEARAFLDASASSSPQLYLLAYKRHFFIVERYYVEALGLDPDDPDWRAIGWDWTRPRSADARRRLYAKVLAAQRATTNSGSVEVLP